MVKILICVLQVQSNIQNCSSGKEIWPNLIYHSCSKGPLKEIIRYMQVKMKFSRFMLYLSSLLRGHAILHFAFSRAYEYYTNHEFNSSKGTDIILTMNLTPLKENISVVNESSVSI